MFRRSTSTLPAREPALATVAGDGAHEDTPDRSLAPTQGRARHTRRARQQQAVDEAALRARLERVHRRLAEVGSVQVTGRAHAIDNDAARRDPLTRPFSAPADAPAPRRRTDTAALPSPA